MAVLAAWVTPIPLTVKLPLPTEILPSDKAALLKRLTLFGPELLRATAPVKLLPELARVSTAAPAAKLAVPAEAAWVIAVLAACVMLTPLMFKVPVPTPMLPKLRVEPLVRETLLLPLLDRETVPVNALLSVKVMAFDPAVKLEVPGTVKTPVWVIAPPAVATKLPPAFSVRVGRAIPVLVKFNVKLRKLLKLARLVGSAALE